MSQMTKVESVAPDFFCKNGKGDMGHYVVVTINVISIVGKLQCYNITTMYASHYTLHPDYAGEQLGTQNISPWG